MLTIEETYCFVIHALGHEKNAADSKKQFPTILFPPFETWVLEVAAVFGSEISAVLNFIKFQFSIAGEK